jgi:hypothetical protein
MGGTCMVMRFCCSLNEFMIIGVARLMERMFLSHDAPNFLPFHGTFPPIFSCKSLFLALQRAPLDETRKPEAQKQKPTVYYIFAFSY